MNLTDKLKKGSSNLSTFENSKEIERKKAMTINVDIEYVDRFKKLAIEYFKKKNDLGNFTWCNFLKVSINFIETKVTLSDFPTDNQLLFFKRPSKIKNVEKKYHVKVKGQIAFTLEEQYLLRYYRLVNTFFNQEESLISYSVSYFFIDMVEFLENNKKDLYKF